MQRSSLSHNVSLRLLVHERSVWDDCPLDGRWGVSVVKSVTIVIIVGEEIELMMKCGEARSHQ